MFVLIGLTVFAVLVLLFGFLEIKIPFVSVRKDLKQNAISASKQPIKIEDNLIKNSIQNSIRNTKFLKERMPENAVTTEAEY